MGQAKKGKAVPASNAMLQLHRLVVIEWLRKDPLEIQTGTNLVNELMRQHKAVNATLVVCNSKQDVIDAIEDAGRSISQLGNPIIHIEAHGFVLNVSTDPTALGFEGPGPNGPEILLWKDVLPHLQTVNIESGFNLLAAAAACVSADILGNVPLDGPLPFVLALTFDGLIHPDDLQQGLVTFYSSALLHRTSIVSAIEKANKTIAGATRLHVSSLPFLIRQAAKPIIKAIWSLELDRDAYMQSCGAFALQGRLSPQDHVRIRRAHIASGINTVLHTLLALDRLPGNATRFQIDADRLVHELRPRW
jgi:hypothetical protein